MVNTLTMRSNSASRTLDPVATRQQILEAATKVFSEKGFSATSINEIADRAKVTKSLVLYHFESKDQLWSACLDLKVKPALEGMQAFLDSDEPLPDRLKEMVRRKYAVLRADTELSRLMAWMSLEPTLVDQNLSDKAHLVRGTITKSSHQLDLPQGVDSEMFVMLLLSACDGWFRFRKLYQVVSGCETLTPHAEEAFVDVLLKVAFPTKPLSA